jgi:hypothetical protein
LPGIQISGFGPKFPGDEVGTFNGKYATASVGSFPAEFDLAITACAIYIEPVVSGVVFRFEYFVLFWLGSRVVFHKFTEVPSLNFIIIIFLYLFFEFKVPKVISPKWSPFLPGFTIRSGEDLPNPINIQFMTAAFCTGKFPEWVFVHGGTP